VICGFVPLSGPHKLSNNSKRLPQETAHIASDTRANQSHIDNAELFREWQKSARISDQSDKNYATGLCQILQTASALALSKEIIETAALLLKDAFKKRLAKGRSIPALCGAALYAACRKHGTTKSLEEIAFALKTDKRKVAQSFRALVDEAHLSLPRFDLDNYCKRILNDLQAGHATIEMAGRFLVDLQKSRMSVGKDPRGISAAIAYLASTSTGEALTQREISRVSNITETTIRNRCREIKKLLYITTMSSEGP
jgi:transcription initiation factor TFIIB